MYKPTTPPVIFDDRPDYELINDAIDIELDEFTWPEIDTGEVPSILRKQAI